DEFEQRRFTQKQGLETIWFGNFYFYVWCDTTTAVDFAPAVGVLDLGRRRLLSLIVIIVVKRLVCIIALNKPSACRVPFSGRKRNACALAQRENCLYETLAKTGLA